MSEVYSDLRRVASSGGLYAAGQLLTRGLAFFLLPVYTRFLDQSEYGALELLATLSAILLSLVMLGMPSALNKCYHRDCHQRQSHSTPVVIIQKVSPHRGSNSNYSPERLAAKHKGI